MATLLAAENLAKSYDSRQLFQGVAMRLVENDRVGIIGPNGAGKSTLLKILAGIETPDAGDIARRRGLKLVYVPQNDAFPPNATPRSAVVDEINRAAREGGSSTNEHDHRIDPSTRATIMLTKLGFVNEDQPVTELSGGWRKRLSLACALVHEPDALLLDEPTNHLDLEGILWLEKFARQSRMAIAFITHDRRFLENVATRLIELSPAYPGGTFEVAGNYTEFVRRKEEFLDGQASAQATLANMVRRDTAWLLQGVKARRTRNKTQLDDTIERKAELNAIRARNDAPSRTTAIDFQATERKTQKLLTLHGVTKSMGSKKLFDSVELMLSPGRRIGLLGANGSGKTTLLRLMSGELPPDAGTIKRAADLRVVTFSQHRHALVPTQTLHEALCPIGDVVHYLGKPIHVTGWAKKFLFAPDQLRTFISHLSGGEQARVLIAKLMLERADVLLLDEPTNDLDIPSLEVLEQALTEFPGAIVLITHDRFMLERVSTEFLTLDGNGHAHNYASIEQWQQAVAAQQGESSRKATETDRKTPSASAKPASSTKLSYKLQRELDGMEAAILGAEEEVARLQALAEQPDVLADRIKLTAAYDALAKAQSRVQSLYDRWTELEALQQS
ncbi:MAG TPA: ABC-F family ATP-binding cassette domain-containing protein [Phycisphaerales bacterium]|nr:ABC-F family ATP-binding cassette domain-containing protein [Phycisphaerales bacterium]